MVLDTRGQLGKHMGAECFSKRSVQGQKQILVQEAGKVNKATAPALQFGPVGRAVDGLCGISWAVEECIPITLIW